MQLPDLFLDIDSTLVVPKKVISETNRGAIKRYIQAGGRVHLVTGKVTAAIIDLVHELGLEHLPHAGANGGMIYENGEEKLMAALKHNGKAVIEVLNRHHLDYYLYYKDHVEYAHENPKLAQVEKIIKINEPTPIFNTKHNYEGLIKVLIYLDEDTAIEKQIRTDLKDIDGLIVTRTSHDLLEFLHQDQYKAKALDYIINDPTRLTIAVGDSENDLTMLEKADYGYIVANASDKMKAKGFNILPSCEDNGVAFLIDAILTGKELKDIHK